MRRSQMEREQSDPFEMQPDPMEFEPDEPEFDDATPLEFDDDPWEALVPDDDELDPLPEPGDFWIEFDQGASRPTAA